MPFKRALNLPHAQATVLGEMRPVERGAATGRIGPFQPVAAACYVDHRPNGETGMRIAAAGNVEIPAFLVLVSKGYSVQRSLDGDIETWCATKGENVFQAESLLQLLGIAVVSEERGQAWRASDEQIDAFLNRFNIEN